jgi:NAD+ synthetase
MVIIGYVNVTSTRKLVNAAAVIENGTILGPVEKQLLPNYNVFDERRYFVPGNRVQPVFTKDNYMFGIVICEDLWDDDYQEKPVRNLKLHNKDLDFIISINASPFAVDKDQLRNRILCRRYEDCKVPIIWVNQVGAQDSIIFDGASRFINSDEDLSGIGEYKNITQFGESFKEDFAIINFEDGTFAIDEKFERHRKVQLPQAPIAKIYHALVLGIHDYFDKAGFKTAVLGLSGGIDSALTAALAVDALGAENVTGIMMPSSYSSRGSIDDALALAQALGFKTYEIPISLEGISGAKGILETYNNFLKEISNVEWMKGNTSKQYRQDVTEQNLQARIRGNILMAFSNETGALVLSTGNKSELSVGYCTLYGDMCGGLGVISDVYKTTVFELANFYNNYHGKQLIPQNSITKPPSAELKPDQKDTDSLPPYEVLDKILKQYIERKKSYSEIVSKLCLCSTQPKNAQGLANDVQSRAVVKKVIQMVDRNEYKRRQAASGLIISETDLTVGRRMPIVNGFKLV